LNHVGTRPVQLADGETAARPAEPNQTAPAEVIAVPILSLRPGESPRLEGENRAHVARLAESEASLPPILVDRRTMRVIDGMHRLLAASLMGRRTVDVVFFDGSPAEAFLRAVEANVTHGLPLSQSDRRAAAARIIASHPHMSDRAIGESTGLAPKTVAAIRRSADALPQLDARVGRDGRVRPLNSDEGRRHAAELLATHPGASLREVARQAGVSPSTAGDVRRRLARGEDPTLTRPAPQSAATQSAATQSAATQPAATQPRQEAPPPRPAAQNQPCSAPAAVAKLLRDPSLRHTEHGRQLLRLLQLSNSITAKDWPGVVAAVPPHCTAIVEQVARHYAQMWLGVAQELDQRLRVIDPAATRPGTPASRARN
jgi:ParB-like chromosome segregation protein Spo0J